MRKNLFLLTMASTLLTLSSCKKVWDYVKDHPNGTADNCRIENIYFNIVLSDPMLIAFDTLTFRDTANFKYNVKGQLASIDYASTEFNRLHLPWNGNWPLLGFAFTYDSRGRLLAYFEIGEKNEQLGDNIFYGLHGHKYTYITDKLITDSVFTYATGIQNGDDISLGNNNNFLNAYSIILDDWGRIVKYGDITYTYDASGNLVKPGVTYTNKKNLLQTNKVLMFIMRDYSVNTPTGVASQFNSNQLPTKINNGALPLFTYPEGSGPYNGYDQNIKVEYQCK